MNPKKGANNNFFSKITSKVHRLSRPKIKPNKKSVNNYLPFSENDPQADIEYSSNSSQVLSLKFPLILQFVLRYVFLDLPANKEFNLVV